MPLHGVGGLERSVRDLVRHLAARDVDVTLITPPPGAVGRHDWRRIRSRRRASACGTCATSRFRSPTGAARRFSIAAPLSRSSAGGPAGWPRRSCAPARWTSCTASARACWATRSRMRAARHGAARLQSAGPRGVRRDGGARSRVSSASATRRCAGPCVGARAPPTASSPPIASLEPTVARHLQPRAGSDAHDSERHRPDRGQRAGRAGRGRDAAPARTASAPARSVLLSVGRLEDNKGFDVLAAALARAARPGSALSATGWRWVIVGAGPFRRELERAVDAHRPRRARDLRRTRDRRRPARVVRSGVGVRPSDALRGQLARDARGDGAPPAGRRRDRRRPARQGPARRERLAGGARRRRRDLPPRSRRPSPTRRGSSPTARRAATSSSASSPGPDWPSGSSRCTATSSPRGRDDFGIRCRR